MNAIKIRQNLLFHYLKYHKGEINELRIWYMARLLDLNGTGWVEFGKTSKALGLTKKYCYRVCQHSKLFRKINNNKLYCVSLSNILRQHRLSLYRGKYRLENNNALFKKNFKSNRRLRAYIAKCFMENDLDKKLNYKMTKGMIGYNTISRKFGITRDTAIRYIKLSGAKWENNEITYPKYIFSGMKEFGVWQTQNMENKFAGIKMSNQSRSFFLHKVDYELFILKQVLPNRYYFTGVCLLGVRSYRGRG